MVWINEVLLVSCVCFYKCNELVCGQSFICKEVDEFVDVVVD